MIFSNEDFKYKIINASASRLLIVTYEIILDRIAKSKAAIRKGNNKDLAGNINNARQFVTELVCSLDMNVPVALEMAELYFFVNKLLIKGYLKKDEQMLDKAQYIITMLKNGLAKEVDDGLPEDHKSAAICNVYLKSS